MTMMFIIGHFNPNNIWRNLLDNQIFVMFHRKHMNYWIMWTLFQCCKYWQRYVPWKNTNNSLLVGQSTTLPAGKHVHLSIIAWLLHGDQKSDFHQIDRTRINRYQNWLPLHSALQKNCQETCISCGLAIRESYPGGRTIFFAIWLSCNMN